MGATGQRVVQRHAIIGLVLEAQAARAQLFVDDPDHDFYLGVEAAAVDALHPELAWARPDGWLDRESAIFREGYLTAANLIGTTTATSAPLRIPLPVPPARARHAS